MTLPIDITDPRVVKAYSHPLRIRILRLLEDRTASPTEISAKLDVPLSNASYHVRKLLELGLIELVGQVQRRGVIEHRYAARYHPTISDDELGALPPLVRQTYMRELAEFGWTHVAAAAEDGGFDRSDTHFTRIHGRLDDAGWKLVADELKASLERIGMIFSETKRRLAEEPDTPATDATVMLLHFAGPTGEIWREAEALDRLRAQSGTVIRAETENGAGGRRRDTPPTR
ncbi:MAG TPA: winged helix-turn-helix domain-containing protein [Microvirga sp.]|nr:winged helix-turn-helix domain-containing protein [Microvirga sp.]